MRRPAIDRPLLHRGRDLIGERRVELVALFHAPAQRRIRGLRESRSHLVETEDVGAEELGKLGARLGRDGDRALLGNGPYGSRTRQRHDETSLAESERT